VKEGLDRGGRSLAFCYAGDQGEKAYRKTKNRKQNDHYGRKKTALQSTTKKRKRTRREEVRGGDERCDGEEEEKGSLSAPGGVRGKEREST